MGWRFLCLYGIMIVLVGFEKWRLLKLGMLGHLNVIGAYFIAGTKLTLFEFDLFLEIEKLAVAMRCTAIFSADALFSECLEYQQA